MREVARDGVGEGRGVRHRGRAVGVPADEVPRADAAMIVARAPRSAREG